MNTPAHAVLSLLVLDRGRLEGRSLPILVGSLLPDAPMLLFYLYEKLVLRTPEAAIWGERYFQAGWQAVFDLFNSIPIALAIALVAWHRRAWGWFGFAASVILHCLADLPLHNDDGHRHFFPLSGWRFESPVSYWDPAHGGVAVGLLEVVGVAIGCVVLFRRHDSKWARALVVLVATFYVLYLAFAVTLWM